MKIKQAVLEKILLIQFRQIGDVILTTPIPRILRQHFPHAEIDFLTFGVNEVIWRYNPYITNLITFDKKRGNIAFARLLMQIRKKQYHAVLDFQDTPRSTYCILLSGAKYRITWENSSRRIAYNALAPRTEDYPCVTKTNLLKPLIPDFDINATPAPRPEVYCSKTETKHLETIFSNYGLGPDDLIVTMAPTHRRKVRRWPLSHFLETARFLIETYNAKVILSWGPGEEEYIRSGLTKYNYTHPNLITDLFLNLLEMAALMQKAGLHLGNDSAPQHLATAQNLPTFTIFGATSDTWAYPSSRHVCVRKNLDCQPCNKLECKFGSAMPCLKELSFQAIRPQLETFIQDVILKK